MPRPDPTTEAERIRQDLYYLLTRMSAAVSRCDDPATLKRLQTSLTRWLHQHQKEEG